MNSTPAKQNNLLIILILGALSTVTPFAIDMYLPAFKQIGADYGVPTARVALSVSSYFIGLALGQIFYGPLLDRFGRKIPLYCGLFVFVLASLGCMTARNIETLIVLRFVQAMGGCVAQVASTAMVRDFFPAKEGARIFAMLILILGVSPLLAPTTGGFIAKHLGWQAVFATLAAIVFVILLAARFYLPPGRAADPTVSLKPKPIALNFLQILRTPQFYTYALSGAFSFAGLFVYVAGAPVMFLEVFHVSQDIFPLLFAFLAIGFIGASQLNLILTRRFNNDKIFKFFLLVQCIAAIVFLLGALTIGYGLVATVILWFIVLACAGITYPNAAALAMAPFGENAGSASALLGFLQMGAGALASTGVGMIASASLVPALSVLAATTVVSFVILMLGKRNITAHIEITDGEILCAAH